MGGLFGGGQSTSTVAEKLAGIQLQTSSYGGPVALAYGTCRIPANLLMYDDFKAIPHTTAQTVGKGGGGSTMSNTTFTYEALVMAGICEGPIAGINRVWKDKEVGAVSTWWDSYFSGARPQTPWAALTTLHPDKAIGYFGTAYVANDNLDLGDSATMKNFSFEVKALLATILDPASGQYDAHPADIITHFLTDPDVGAGWYASRLGDFVTGASSFKTYCTAAGLFLSPLFKEQRAAKEHLKQILDATNSDPVWTSGPTSMVLKIIPYGDQPITGNSTTYTPNTTPLYDLGPDDFMQQSPDPIIVERQSQADTFNVWPVEFTDRALDYNTNVVSSPAQEDVDAFGERVKESTSLPCIARASIAAQISDIKAKRSINCRNKYKFKLGWRYILLEPMDLVTLTEPIAELDHKVVRIREIEESEDGYLTVVAEEWPFGVATATAYAIQSGSGTAPDVNADPGNSNAPIIFEPPSILNSTGQGEVWIGASGTPNLWGGAEVWISTDGGSSYSMVGSISQPARHGVTTASLASSADPDTTHTLAVDLSASGGTLSSTDANACDAFATLSLVENELVSYQAATLTGPHAYNLGTRLRRGVYGSTIAAHSSGVRFMRLDETIFKLPYDASLRGKTLHLKLVSINVWGGGKQDISTVPDYTFTPSGVSYPQPTTVTIAVSDTQPT